MNFDQAKAHIIHRFETELNTQLSYHSLEHVLDVYRVAAFFAERESVTEHEKQLLLTAALYHDAGFLVQRESHEESGCAIAREVLPDFGYSTADIKMVCGMIMATKIPQKPGNLLEEIMCDADLDYLGREDFFRIGNLLFLELKELGTICTEKEWNILQVKFLKAHHYFTHTAKELRMAQKQKHLEYLELLVDTYD